MLNEEHEESDVIVAVLPETLEMPHDLAALDPNDFAYITRYQWLTEDVLRPFATCEYVAVDLPGKRLLGGENDWDLLADKFPEGAMFKVSVLRREMAARSERGS